MIAPCTGLPFINTLPEKIHSPANAGATMQAIVRAKIADNISLFISFLSFSLIVDVVLLDCCKVY